MNDEGARVSERPKPAKAHFFASPVIQASVPAGYAWATTVAPLAFGKGGTTLGQVFALLALTFVGLAVTLESMNARSRFALPALVWGMTLFSSGSFVAATPRALASIDTTRGVAGVLGWLLFALASAAPALRRAPDNALTVKALSRSAPSKSAFGFLLVVALVLAIVLMGFGWAEEPVERAVLVRVASIVLSLLLLGLATKFLGLLSGADPAERGRAHAPSAFQTTLRVLVTLLVLALAGLYWFLRS